MSGEGGRQDRAEATKARNVRRCADIVVDLRQEAERREQEIFGEDTATPKGDYARWVVELQDYIACSYQGVDRYTAQKELAALSRSLLDRRDLDSPVCDAPMFVKPSQTTRPYKGFEFARKLDGIEKNFQERLMRACEDDARGAQTWTGLALWSAISRSQLNTPEHLNALINWLCQKEGGQFGRGVQGRTTIRLVIRPGSKDKVFLGNRWADADKTVLERVHYFYPDILTLVLLKRARARFEDQKVSSLDPHLCLRAALGGGERKDFPGIAKICANARWLADVRPNLRVSEAFLSVADGSLDNVGLDDAGHDLLFSEGGKIGGALPSMRGEVRKPEVKLTEPARRGAVTPSFRQLQEILQKKDREYTKEAITAEHLGRLRDEIENGDAIERKGSIVHLLVSWLHHLAVKDELKTSTLATYFSRIGAPLYESLDELNPADLDPETLSEIFQSILGRVVHSSTRADTRFCLKGFHRFACANGDLPPLRGDLGLGADQFVRARVLPLWQFRQVCAQLQKDRSAAEARVLIIAALIAYRGGLRAGEVLGLAGRDLLDSDHPWLLVRPNSFGRLKTLSGRRRIPIGQLLLPEERAALREYYRDGPSKWPRRAFLHDPWLGRSDKRSWISREVSEALKAVCGFDWTFHHLRHSAANNLLLALEGYKCEAASELCKQITGWSAENQKLICRSVAEYPDNAQSNYIALAGFMGHASPSHTFSSYLHLIEPIMALRRTKVSVAEDATLLAAALDRPLKWIEGRVTDGALHDALEGRLRHSGVQADNLECDEKPDEPEVQVTPPLLRIEQRIYPTDIFDFLHEVERSPDTAIETVGPKYQIPGDIAVGYVSAARTIAALKTRGGKPRFEKPRDRSADPEYLSFLLPSPLRGNEGHLIRDAIERVRIVWNKSPESRAITKAALGVFLRRYYADSIHLRLSWPELESFRRFTELVGMRPEIKAVKSRARSGSSDKEGRTRPSRKYDIKWAIRPGRGTRALAIVCHWLVIRLYSADQIREMASAPKTIAP
jgi:integrase